MKHSQIYAHILQQITLELGLQQSSDQYDQYLFRRNRARHGFNGYNEFNELSRVT